MIKILLVSNSLTFIVVKTASSKWVPIAIIATSISPIPKALSCSKSGVKDNEDKMSLNIGANYIVKKGDRFFVIGKTDDLEKFDYYTK